MAKFVSESHADATTKAEARALAIASRICLSGHGQTGESNVLALITESGMIVVSESQSQDLPHLGQGFRSCVQKDS